MFWILIALGVCFGTLFAVLQVTAARQTEEDIALILSESQTELQSIAPSTKP